MVPAQLHEQHVAFAGVRSRVLSVAGDGPPFVLLHGYSDSADTWRPLMRCLAASGRAAVAVDLPGFGRADRADPGALLPQIDRFVAEVVAQHAVDDSVTVVGNSLGAVASLRLAQRDELPVAGVVPIAPAGLGHARWVDLIAREPIVHRISAAPVPLPVPIWVLRRALGFAFARLAVARPNDLDRAARERYASHFSGQGDVRRTAAGAWTLLAELADCYELERIGRPVLLVWGAHDRLIPQDGARRVLDAVPGSRLAVLDDCGHCPQLEDPESVARMLVEFDRGARAATTEAA